MRGVTVAVMGLCAAGAAPAFAEEATAASGAASDPATEIIVTARRKAEANLDVPAAITVISSEALRDQRIRSLLDIGLTTPGLNAVRNFDTTQVNYSIRGQGNSSKYLTPPSVINYFNEVPSGSLGTPLFDLESVQVLKGPQGTLFGGTSTGGAVLFTSKRPSFDAFEGYGQISSGNLDYREIQGAVNLPVSSWLAVRLAGFVTRRDGHTKVINIPGLRMGDSHQDSFRASVRIKPTDWLTNDTIYSYNNIHVNGGALVFSGYATNPQCPNFTNMACVFGADALQAELDAQRARGPFRIKLTPPALGEPLGNFFVDRRKVHSVINSTEISLNDALSFRNIFGYSARKSPTGGTNIRGVDVDGSIFPGLYISGTFLDGAGPETLATDEFQIKYNVKDKYDFIAGVYYEKAHQARFVTQRFIFPFFEFTTPPSLASHQIQKAIYAQATLQGSLIGLNGLSATLGGRETWAKSAVFLGSPSKQSTSSKAFTYTASLDYKPSDNLLLYVTHRKGFKPGGSNQVGILTLPDNIGPYTDFGPEVVKDYEVGAKAEFNIAGIRGSANIAAYWQDFSGAQRTVVLAAATNITVNAQSATVKGVELDMSLRLSDRLRVSAGYAHISPKWKKYLSPNFGDGMAGTPITFVDLGATKFAETAKNNFSVSAAYDLPVLPENMGTMTLSGTYFNQSALYDTEDNIGIPEARLPGYGVAKARLEWRRIAGSRIDAAIFADNVFNKKYAVGGSAAVLATNGFAYRTYGDPRTYGAELRVSW